MEQFSMQAAGRVVAVSALYKATQKYCEAYLCDGEPDFSVTITPQDIVFEQDKANKENELEGLPVHDIAESMLERTAVQRKIAEGLFAFDTILFHGSVIAVDGEAYLFTAKSGTGKSTHTRLWREVFGERAVMVNDDKPILRFADGSVQVYGTPWNGKHCLGENICCPLKAMCILERGEENRIRKIAPREVLLMLVQQSNRPRDSKLMPKYMELVDALAGNVAFYRMACNMDPEAARLAYETMSGKEETE